MSSTTGISEQTLSLPKGGGAEQGLGEKFQPDLHTGTGSYAIPIDIPNGPGGIAPRLTLTYHTGAGNGPFGMGFGLPLFAIRRSTEKRIPAYRDEDPLILVGGGDLVAAGGGVYRLKVDTSGLRISREGAGFRLRDREGRSFLMGVSQQARLYTVEDGIEKVLSWHLERIVDALGNEATLTYTRDGDQLYLERVTYGIYAVGLTYEVRPDPILDGRAGILITTRRRCTGIELSIPSSPTPLVRRWALSYLQSPRGGHSLLHQVRLTGFDEAGATANLPPLTLDYTGFQPRELERFRSAVPDAVPGPFAGGTRELLDWDGDGLPDLLELGGGSTRVWQNLGDGVWGEPRSLSTLPVPVPLHRPGVAFADMDGNGTSDLVMLDRPLAGYYPHRPGGGFDAPVFFERVPGVRLGDPEARLVDLNADGIADLLFTGDRYFLLFFRKPGGGWQEIPEALPRSSVPPVSFRDARVHLADMNGDGLQDLVRVDGAGVTYWPYLGNGRWGEAVTLANPPRLPASHDPKRLFLSDVDGDGCADLIYVDQERVTYWINQGGTRLSDPEEIGLTPPSPIDQIRIADMKGSGTAGVLWSYTGLGSRGTAHFYLDFAGSTKPYLLRRIDTGMGLVTEIDYGTSTQEAIRDRAAGAPWKTFLPFPVPVITAVAITDQATGVVARSRYRYHEGHFDGIAREFAGFGQVEVDELGDETAPSMRTRNWHHLGLDPDDLSRPLTELERSRLRALRGKLLKTEVYGLDGSLDEARPYSISRNQWTYRVEAAGSDEVLFPYLEEARVSFLERQATAFRETITRNLAFDAFGNTTEQEQRAEDPRDASLTQVLRTSIRYATDPAGVLVSKPVQTIQRDGSGRVVASTISYYDGLPEGHVGAEGLLTRQESLILTDDIVSSVYGTSPPGFASLGYHRRAGEDGWWVYQVTYTRTDDTSGLRGTATNARGYTTQLFFEPGKMHPNRVIDPLGNVMEAVYDPRANKLRTLTDSNGVTASNRYDPLGRLERTLDPGATEAMPTTRYTYLTDVVPQQIVIEQRGEVGSAEVITRKIRYDGSGQVIEERVVDEAGEVVERSQIYSARGFVRAQLLPYMTTGTEYVPPAAGLLRRSMRYDVLGRLIEVTSPDGTVQRQRFEPGVAYLHDEEDTRTDASAPHRDTPTRHTFAPTGRLLEVAQNDRGRWIATRYEYDVKGNIIAVEDAAGQRTTLAYDLLGRRLRTSSPQSGASTFVFDAQGNQVRRMDAAGDAVDLRYDELNRLERVTFPATGEVSASYVYHDAGRPAPAEAGSFTRGRLVKVTHAGGENVFAYDALGRVTTKTVRPSALPGRELQLDFTYRDDGQWHTVTYPAPSLGAGRMQVRYEYNRRGRLRAIPGFIRRVDYHVVGLRTLVVYDNDVETSYTYDPARLRLQQLLIRDGAASILRQCGYEHDRVGNLLKVTSPSPELAADYTYDDLYRLTSAATQSGRSWTYQYDDLGNLTSKSDVGSYHYTPNGLLTAAGAWTFSHTAAGQMLDAPWGRSAYDPLGRLIALTRDAEQMRCTYDHDGRRVRMQVTGAPSAQEILTPDELFSFEDGVMFGHVMDGTARAAQVRLDTTATSFLHGDHLGSTTLVTGPGGAVLQTILYDPFGLILASTVSSGTGTPYLYTGQRLDVWSGLYYLHARYYHPQLGRFTTPDRVVPNLYHPQAWNRYSYVQNNPLRYIDPTGHFWEEIGEWFEKNWQYVVAAVVIVALVVLTVLTAGALAGVLGIAVGWVYAGVAAGMAIGGVVGGIAASTAGGDVLLGVLVGVALGGGAALAGMGIGAGMAAAFGAKTFLATVLTGALSGSVQGAAMGFAAGFAGGQGTSEQIWEKVWQGALAGAISGTVYGLGSYGIGGSLGANRLSIALPKGVDAFKGVALGATAGAAAEIGRQAAADGKIDWGKVGLGALGGAGLGSFIKFGDSSGVAVLSFLRPEYAGIVGGVFAATNSGILVLDYWDNIYDFLRANNVESPDIKKEI